MYCLADHRKRRKRVKVRYIPKNHRICFHGQSAAPQNREFCTADDHISQPFLLLFLTPACYPASFRYLHQVLPQVIQHRIGLFKDIFPDNCRQTAGLVRTVFQHKFTLHPRSDLPCPFVRQYPEIRFPPDFRHRPGIGHIKYIAQLPPASLGIINQGNADSAAPDPAIHPPVPDFHGSTGSSIGSLGIDQQLILKRIQVYSRSAR